MKRTHYKSITMTVGLISLMLVSVLLIALATQLAKGNALYAKFIGILLIIAGACLSLNTATTILDKPKETVPSKYRKFVIGIIIATGVVVILWLIVLFATDPGLIVRYATGKRFKYPTTDYADEAAALAAADNMKNKIRAHLIITQITVAVTIIVAYFNLVVPRRFIFKNRMIPIQVALYLGAFLFYIWFFLFALSPYVKVNQDTGGDYIRVIITSNITLLTSSLGITLALSGLAIYLIARFSSIWAVRRFKNEGLYDEKAIVKSDVNEPKAEEPKAIDKPVNDVKARLEKLNELHEQGLISDEDYEKKKADIIDSL